MAKFRKRADVPDIEAVQFDPMSAHKMRLPDGVQGAPSPGADNWAYEGCRFFVTTMHGHLTPIEPGDWIVTERDGEHHYPVKPDVFESTYEAVSAETAPWTPVDFGSVEEHAQRAGRPSTRKETTVSEAPSFTKGELDWYARNSDSIVGEFAREIKRLQARVEELQEELHATDVARLRTDGPHG